MSVTAYLFLYDLILVAIVGTYMATKVLREWSIRFLNRDPAKAGEKAAAAAAKLKARLEAQTAKAAAKLEALTDRARNTVADGLEDTAEAVRADADDKDQT